MVTMTVPVVAVLTIGAQHVVWPAIRRTGTLNRRHCCTDHGIGDAMDRIQIDHVEIVVDPESGGVGIFVSPEIASSVAVLLHLVDERANSILSPRLVPLMRGLDRVLVGYDEGAS